MAMKGLIFCHMSSEQLVDQVVYFRVVVYSRTSTALRSHESGKNFAFGESTFVNPGDVFIFFSSCRESAFQASIESRTTITEPKKF